MNCYSCFIWSAAHLFTNSLHIFTVKSQQSWTLNPGFDWKYKQFCKHAINNDAVSEQSRLGLCIFYRSGNTVFKHHQGCYELWVSPSGKFTDLLHNNVEKSTSEPHVFDDLTIRWPWTHRKGLDLELWV